MRRGTYLLALGLFSACAPMHRAAWREGRASAPLHPKGWTSTSTQARFRTQLGFTPRAGWMNDPNGLAYVDGTWHLFFQHNPKATTWGDIAWGHAASRDLVHWREGPVAIAPWVDPEDPRHSEMVFSGSAVLDEDDVSGLGRDGAPALLAFYTSAYSWVTPARGQQAISLAVSLDGGETFTRHPGNPVVALPPGNPERVDGNEFRDPKVFWHAPSERWIMLVALAADRRIRFFESQDLLHWSHLSDFGPANSYAGIWEVPDLFELPVKGEAGASRWVLVVSVNGGTRYGGSGVQAFVGRFDGQRFVAEDLWRPEGEVFEDFEDALVDWTVRGHAPTVGAPVVATRRPVQAFEGAGLLDTFAGDDARRGTLTSPTFSITHDFVQLLVGGGRADQGVRVALLVDDREVRQASGDRSETLEWVQWDVRDLRDETARLVIVDEGEARGAHLLLDHVVFTDAPLPAPADRAKWVDGGMDFYAPTTFFGAPGGEAVWLGWQDNWQYAGGAPTEGFRGAMSFARRLSLRPVDGRLVLAQTPVGLEALRIDARPFEVKVPLTLDDEAYALPHRFAPGSLLEVELEVRLAGAARVCLDLFFGDRDVTRVFYDVPHAELGVDRTQSGEVDFARGFSGVHTASLPADGDRIRLRALVDTAAVSVFGGDGEAVITDRIFPDPDGEIGIVLSASNGAATVQGLRVRRLASIWATMSPTR